LGNRSVSPPGPVTNPERIGTEAGGELSVSALHFNGLSDFSKDTLPENSAAFFQWIAADFENGLRPI
jgi:hypothetical protein